MKRSPGAAPAELDELYTEALRVLKEHERAERHWWSSGTVPPVLEVPREWLCVLVTSLHLSSADFQMELIEKELLHDDSASLHPFRVPATLVKLLIEKWRVRESLREKMKVELQDLQTVPAVGKHKFELKRSPFRGSVATATPYPGELPSMMSPLNQVGDSYYVSDEKVFYVWTGTAWEPTIRTYHSSETQASDKEKPPKRTYDWEDVYRQISNGKATEPDEFLYYTGECPKCGAKLSLGQWRSSKVIAVKQPCPVCDQMLETTGAQHITGKRWQLQLKASQDNKDNESVPASSADKDEWWYSIRQIPPARRG